MYSNKTAIIKMKNILITGATGTVGMEVIKSLSKLHHSFDVYARVFNIKKIKRN